jgi:hypothetical protein
MIVHLALNPMWYVVLCNSSEGIGSFDKGRVNCKKCLLIMAKEE